MSATHKDTHPLRQQVHPVNLSYLFDKFHLHLQVEAQLTVYYKVPRLITGSQEKLPVSETSAMQSGLSC